MLLGLLQSHLQKETILRTPLQLHRTSYRGGRAILAAGRAGRAKIKKEHKVCSCVVQDLSNQPLPIALTALPANRLRKLPSLLYDDVISVLYYDKRRFVAEKINMDFNPAQTCQICCQNAPPNKPFHLHYGAICCIKCRSFFRRLVQIYGAEADFRNIYMCISQNPIQYKM